MTVRAIAVLATGCLLLQVAQLRADEEVGATLYAEHCATCHSASLRGSAHGATLRGKSFIDKWQGQTASALLSYNRSNMPPGTAHSLSDTEHVELVQYLIASNANDLSGSTLLASVDELTLTTMAPIGSNNSQATEFSGAGAVMDMARNAGQFESRSVENLAQVTPQDLMAPPPEDWLHWRRTADGQGHSPLKAINTSNVAQLGLRWSVAMHRGSNQGTPLVRDGVMFLTHPNNKIQALNAATGDLIWEYQYDFPTDSKLLGGPTRNIAIYGHRLFMTTYDAALVAIDARSGEQLWRAVKADYRQAFTHSAGPIVAHGVVVSGINGCELFTEDGCFITGHDPNTGEEIWRTSTLALPGTPEYATWGNIAPDRRGGGDTWIAGTYDIELDRVIYGTSQPKPWAAVSRGMTTEDAALYTNSTLALDPLTGEIAWHFQHIPGETIDMEVGFERILATSNDTPVVLTVGKDGILWKLDRRDGSYVDLLETMPQNIFDVDRATGELQYRLDIARAGIGDTFTACPGIYGGHNWQSATFDDAAQVLYLPLHQLCSDMTPREVDLGPGGGGYGADVATYPMPGKEDRVGKLIAIDVAGMKPLWEVEQAALFLSGALTTDGGLLFIGDLDRTFQAMDTETGATLWSTRLPAPAHGYPITYEAGGQQFVAVQTGIGVFRALTAVLFPEIYQPADGQGLFVFGLMAP
ncbi:MAG: PQQ-binding-like beta-propeller repeat protein [Cellvibrionales bacterium]|jgi:alcohol dehydrogenase (cytochrome c)